MKSKVPEGIFKPTVSRAESKSDTTTQVARSILETETASREAKTKRLRQERLAKEAADALIVQPPKRKAVRATRKA